MGYDLTPISANANRLMDFCISAEKQSSTYMIKINSKNIQ